MGISHLEQREAAPEADGCAPLLEMREASGPHKEWTPGDRVSMAFSAANALARTQESELGDQRTQ
jgi:hypothetical protein